MVKSSNLYFDMLKSDNGIDFFVFNMWGDKIINDMIVEIKVFVFVFCFFEEREEV